MTTLAIAAILVALAVPSMASLVAHSAVGATENALFMAAREARTAAIIDNTHTLLCPSVDGRHCSGDTNWQHGWIVGIDRDHDAQPDAAALYSGEPDAHVQVVGSSGRRYVRFRPDGDAAGTNISLVVCQRHHDARPAKVVIVSNAGRIREQHATKSQQARCPLHD